MLKVADHRPFKLEFCLKSVAELALQSKLDPKMGATYSAEKIAEAHALLESGKSTGKVVVNW